MKTKKYFKSIALSVLIAATTVQSNVIFAQDSSTETIIETKNIIKNQTISSENEEKAIELGKWAMPVVSFLAQKEANIRDMGAQPNQILY